MRNTRQRGTVYLLVLGVTTMLVVLGVTAAMVARIVNERGNLQAEQSRAAALAPSYLDIVHAQLAASSTWRATHTNDTWSSPSVALSGGLLSYKVVDEFDGVLNDDAAEPVRVYARAVVGNATRVYSVELKPDADGVLQRDPATLRQDPAG